ncbi:transcriptional regulator [Pseudomonas aeruginosa]|uniref:transcriptional regulator n=1 Tax=Pseudomonas aeruginosa TaxID=287 RepID=UPI001F4A3232|nr:transcriptional regulator [Pseudomonas aeruginosa]MCO3935635.1 transcriptional regulator [Pseudomonas aeruginosa]MDG9800988.1 transcriptional regulator [Pseudomonas aeruginosa]MDG9906106.1 transcriptional regulator [Pseudomonas aeruginosa]MDH0001677.1 transcriptional regulator [Pseudomonas aeruginosa]MDH0009279.1 transcriptional regulator [Pseudomonas aeruginosa]
MNDLPHDEAMIEQFRADPVYAIELLIDVIRSGEDGELAILIRQLTEAFHGGRDELADRQRRRS